MLAALLAFGVTDARAKEDTFLLANQSLERIQDIFLAPTASNRWTRVSSNDVVRVGQVAHVRLPEGWNPLCYYDLRVTYASGARPQFIDLDLCQTREVTLYWDARTRAPVVSLR